MKIKNDTAIVDVFKRELETIENQIKSEVYSVLQNELNKLKEAIINLQQENSLIKQEVDHMTQKIVSASIKGVTEARMHDLVEKIKEMQQELKNINIDEIYEKIIKELEKREKSNLEILEDRISKLDEKINKQIEKISNLLENLDVNVDLTEIINSIKEYENKLNEIDAKLNKISELSEKIDFIYDFNKILEKQLKEKQKMQEEGE